VDVGPCSAAYVLVIGALVAILEASPAAYVIDKNRAEATVGTVDIFYELLERVSAAKL